MVLFRNFPGVPEENYKIYCVEYLLWMPTLLSVSSTVLSRNVSTMSGCHIVACQ